MKCTWVRHSDCGIWRSVNPGDKNEGLFGINLIFGLDTCLVTSPGQNVERGPGVRM